MHVSPYLSKFVKFMFIFKCVQNISTEFVRKMLPVYAEARGTYKKCWTTHCCAHSESVQFTNM